jgi:hypothetical protein
MMNTDENVKPLLNGAASTTVENLRIAVGAEPRRSPARDGAAKRNAEPVGYQGTSRPKMNKAATAHCRLTRGRAAGYQTLKLGSRREPSAKLQLSSAFKWRAARRGTKIRYSNC